MWGAGQIYVHGGRGVQDLLERKKRQDVSMREYLRVLYCKAERTGYRGESEPECTSGDRTRGPCIGQSTVVERSEEHHHAGDKEARAGGS